jgi:uncharacterized membrane protein YsdA (DUF1294 family)
MTNQIIAYYLIIINIVTFLVYGIDKWKARKAMWRVREASLLMLAVLGGSIGAWLGMKVWHHKTQHKKFRYGIPAIIIIQLVIIGYFMTRSEKNNPRRSEASGIVVSVRPKE